MEAAGKRNIWHRSTRDKFRIWNISDCHLLAKGCAEDLLKRDLKKIEADPFSFWLGGGDYCDFIGHTDKRFDPDAIAEWVPVSQLGDLGAYGMRKIRDLFMPIKHKCLGLVIGNHEKHYELFNKHSSLHGWLCSELGVPNLEYSAMFDIVFHRTPKVKIPALRQDTPSHNDASSNAFRVFVHHGAGAACTPAGKLNRLVGFMQAFRADIYFIGHVHDKTARREPCLGADANCTKIRQFDRLGLISGSYLKTYNEGSTSYGEMKGYRPVSLGSAICEITPATRHMEAAI